MKDFITKIDDDATDAGVVVADEYNSIFTEAKNAVKTFLTLDGADFKQLQKAIDIASKAMFYTDAGTANSVQLIRGATTETTETLFDSMVVYFLPSNANTGATTLKVTTLTAKPLFYNGADLPAGYLNTTSKYVAVYDATNDRFNVDVIAGGSAEQPYKIKDAVNNDEAVSKAQMETAVAGGGKVLQVVHTVGLSTSLTTTSNVEIWNKTVTPKSNNSTFYIFSNYNTRNTCVIEPYVNGIFQEGYSGRGEGTGAGMRQEYSNHNQQAFQWHYDNTALDDLILSEKLFAYGTDSEAELWNYGWSYDIIMEVSND